MLTFSKYILTLFFIQQAIWDVFYYTLTSQKTTSTCVDWEEYVTKQRVRFSKHTKYILLPQQQPYKRRVLKEYKRALTHKWEWVILKIAQKQSVMEVLSTGALKTKKKVKIQAGRKKEQMQAKNKNLKTYILDLHLLTFRHKKSSYTFV